MILNRDWIPWQYLFLGLAVPVIVGKIATKVVYDMSVIRRGIWRLDWQRKQIVV